MRYMGKADKIELNKPNLPPLERDEPLHLASLPLCQKELANQNVIVYEVSMVCPIN